MARCDILPGANVQDLSGLSVPGRYDAVKNPYLRFAVFDRNRELGALHHGSEVRCLDGKMLSIAFFHFGIHCSHRLEQHAVIARQRSHRDFHHATRVQENAAAVS